MKDYFWRNTRRFVVLVCTSLAVGSLLYAEELKQETLQSWEKYRQAARAQMNERTTMGSTFLWVDEQPERLRRVRAGEILVAPAAPHIPRRVPSGLIHDWIGAAFFPNTKLEDVLAVVRDYDHYKDYYKPSVVESKALSLPDDYDRFSILFVNKEVVAKFALDSEYQGCYQKLEATRTYAIAYTTRVQEIHDYGHTGERKLPPGHGNGYVWGLYSIGRFEERDGGVYMELEAMALSRDVPFAFRWMVDPIVRRVSKSALLTSLQQTEHAVRLTQVTGGHGESSPPARSAADCSRFGIGQ